MTRWQILLEPKTGFLVGGIGEPPRGVHAAAGFVADAEGGTGRVILPGTSIKGVLREAFRRFSEARIGAACQLAPDAPDCSCPACRVFGTPERSGQLAVRSALVPAETHFRSRVAIERTSRTAAREERALWGEQRAWVADDVRLDVETTGELDPEAADLLETFWAWLTAVGLSVGRGKSTGSGAFRVRSIDRPTTPARPPRRTPSGDAGIGRYRLVVEILEPARLVGLRQREFFRDALDTLPAATLRGAIGWALVRSGLPDVATDLFRSPEAVKLGTGFALPTNIGAQSPDGFVPWLSVKACRGPDRHRVDLTLPRIAVDLDAGRAVPVPMVCPRCGGDLDDLEAPHPPTLVIGRTAIEPRVGRVLPGNLFYEVAVAPGARFGAHLVARPDQAAAIANLEEIWVGGRKRAGQGRARLSVEPLSPEPLVERLAKTAAALSHWGIHSRSIAILGLLGDAAFQRSLRSELESRGLRIITAEVRGQLRGGWDEEKNIPRPLRQVIRAGSWVAVELPQADGRAVLEELEQAGIEDPLGTEPALFWVRSDWEVMGMADHATSARATVVEVDEQIREVRSLCERHQAGQVLPDPSQLRTLLRFAQATDSVQELVLFIQYQASRDQLKRYRGFLTELADLVKRRFADDIEGARRYLGWVVRAGNVARAAWAVQGGQSRGR